MAALPSNAGAHPSWRNLGSYEKEALKEANGGRALDFEPEPEGKTIARVRIKNLNVFHRRSNLSWANWFHITSTEQSIRQELTFKPGDKFVWTNIQQTLRLLRNPFYTAVAAVVPLRSDRPGHIDVFVVTRDRWSVRPNSEFEFQNGKLTSLDLLPAENNFLGRRKRLALEIIADQGEYSLGPRYIDPNVLGKRWRLDSNASLVFNRATDAVEGGKLDGELEYPLWTLQRDWGGSLVAFYKNSVIRSFEDETLRQWQDPVSGALFPYEFRLRTTNVEATVTRQFGAIAIQRLSTGYRLTSNRPAVRSSFTGDADQRARFEQEVLPRSERTSGVFLRYEAFKPKFIIYRNIDNYDLPEEAQTGPRATAEVSTSLQLLGSEVDFLQFGGTVGWWVDFEGQAYLDAEAGYTARFEGDLLEDNQLNGSLKLASGSFLRGHLRVVARGEVVVRLNDENNVLLLAGGETGLRGFPVGAFAGSARAMGNVELRSRPYKLAFMRIGGLLFWDSGHAATKLSRIRLQNDVGAGIRLLVPQVSSQLYRLDWAFPLQSSAGMSAGWPGRVTLGFEQVF